MTKKQKVILQILMFILVIVIIQIQTFSLLAQTSNAGKCNPVDLVILLDESESMYTRNDKNGRRFDAVDTIIDYLGNHAVFLCREEGIQHRISVIGFGDTAVAAVNGDDNSYDEDTRIYLESVTIPDAIILGKSLTEAREIWEPQRDTIVIPDDIKGNLGATDHRSAFKAAEEVLLQWKDEAVGSETDKRRQVVMLLTDGGSCVRNRSCSPDGDNDRLPEEAALLMDELEEILERNGDEFPFYSPSDPESVFITTVFLSRNLAGESFGTSDRWEEIAVDHGGDLYTITSSTSLIATINDALDPVSGSGRTPVECGEPVWVWPYLHDVIIFSAYPLVDNPNEQATVIITTYGDRSDDINLYGIRGGYPITGTISVENMEYDSYKGNESYVFNSPVPGKYQVFVGDAESCTDALSLKLDTVSVSSSVSSPAPNLVLPAVEDGENYSDYLNSKFVLTVTDKNGNLLQENQDHPLIVTAVVLNSEHDYEEIYDLDQIGNGRYESSPIKTPYPGDYSWEVSLTVHHPDPSNPSTVEIIPENSRGHFKAESVDLFGFELVHPISGRFKLNIVSGDRQIAQEIPVEVEFLDEDGQALDAKDVFGTDVDLNSLFKATLRGNGEAILEEIFLTAKPSKNNQVFEGTFTNDNNGIILPAGEYVIEVNAIWTEDDYPVLDYAPANMQDSVTIEQYEVQPLTAVIHPPEDGLTLHEVYPLDTIFGKLRPFEFSVDIVDAISGEMRVLDSVLISKDGVHLVTVIAPSGASVPITLTVKQDEKHQQLIGVAGITLDEDGEYAIKLNLKAIALQDGYAWSTLEETADFSREDTMMTNPFIWQIIAAMIALIIVLIVGFIIYKMTGGPSGSLAIVGRDSYGNEREEWSKKLSYIPRRNRIKSQFLKDAGVAVIYVTRTKSFDQDVTYAVEISAVNEDGIPVFEGVLDNNDQQMFIDEGDILYRR